MAARTTTRMSAAERRESVLRAAITEFSTTGLEGTTTEQIATRAGISQPYLYRLFATKKDLFLTAVERCFARIGEAFTSASGGLEGPAALDAMGAAYQDLLQDRELLRLQLQTYAACDDPEVQAAARKGFGELWQLVEEASGCDYEAIVRFFATGMLLNVAAAMDLPNATERWAQICCSITQR